MDSQAVIENQVEIVAGNNIEIVRDGNKIYISAPITNFTRLKEGPFTLFGESVEIQSGPNIKISSIHPNKLIISADISKETLRIVELEKRVENLEKAVSGLLKRGQVYGNNS